MNLDPNPEPKQITSALNICEWIQFMKEECNSLEEEKRFLTTQLIAMITAIAILIWLIIELSNDQVSYDLGQNKISYFKIVFASLIIVLSFQIYKMFSLLYAITLDEHILQIINAPKIKEGYFSIIPIIFIFSIVLYHRLSPLIFSSYTIPVEILNSTTYWILLFILALETCMAIFAVFWERKFSEVINTNLLDKENLKKSLAFGVVYQIFILILIIWVLENLEWPPYELFKIQLKFGLAIIFLFFIIIYWAKPLYFRLKEIAIRINQLNMLIDEVLRGEIAHPEEIILRRDKLKIYWFDT